ncbi:unnamed protein product [Meloidogyne enterolobii]|uniref:Uncharacterized protein n=1 Tax=Meloidogyne enterolobii TaxID=390850 RepID=A0ACB1AU14_MELEN
MSKLRFILGTEFDKIIPDEEKSKIKLVDNVIVFTIKNLKNALNERLNVLSKYVQAKEKIKNGNKKSFLNFLFDSKVLDINMGHEKQSAILDKVDKDKHDEILFDLFFCDITKHIEYNAANDMVLNKKQENKIFEGNQIMIISIYSIGSKLLKNLKVFTNESFFLSEKIKNRYRHIIWLILHGMEEVKYNSQRPLTRTGKVYKSFATGRIWYKDHPGKDENISVQIFETKTTITIKAETPMAIVELIEEVKNEREELREMNDEEFKKKREYSLVAEEEHKHDQKKKEILAEIENEQNKIFEESRNESGKLVKDVLKELNEESDKLLEEIWEIEDTIRNLEIPEGKIQELRVLKEKRDEILRKIREIKLEYYYKELDKKSANITNQLKNLLEQKLRRLKVENDNLLKEDIEVERKNFLEKYDEFIVELKERWFRAVFYRVFNEVYKTEDKNTVKIKLSKEKEVEKEKGESSTSMNVETLQNKQDKHILYFDKNSLIGKTLLLNIYGKENAIKLVKGKKDSPILVNINDGNSKFLKKIESNNCRLWNNSVISVV